MGGLGKLDFNKAYRGKYANLNKNDVVFTPDWLAKYIVQSLPIEGKILEPCKGEGAFLKYLPAGTEWCEITEGVNFFDYDKKVDWIVTNPPYSDFNRFLSHSFELSENVVFLTPIAKVFKSIGTINLIMNYGGFVQIELLSGGKAGFPFGFPCGIYWMKKGYKGETTIKLVGSECKERTIF